MTSFWDKTMWCAKLSRDSLLQLLQGRELPVAFEEAQGPSMFRGLDAGEFLAVWKLRPISVQALPQMVVGAEHLQDDLLAWVAVNVLGLNPFTAYCRVADVDVAATWLFDRNTSVMTGLGNSFVGLILAEAALRNPGHALDSITPYGCAQTLSYVVSRALIIGYLPERFDSLLEAWRTARSFDSGRREDRLATHLHLVWAVLAWINESEVDAGNDEPKIPGLAAVHDVLTSVMKGGPIPPAVQGALFHGMPLAESALAAMGETRERRVAAFDRMIHSIRDSQADLMRMPLAIGYLASRISPGTLDHLGLLDPIKDAIPSAVLWYGLLAGTATNSSVAASFRGLGSRILRELVRSEDPLEVPRADVSLRELQVLSRTPKWRQLLRTNGNSVIVVELLPGVVTYVGKSEAGPINDKQPNIFDQRESGESMPDYRLKRQLERALGLIEQAASELQQIDFASRGHPPTGLHEKRSRGRGKPRTK